jgi:hypothetical protein
MLSKRESKAQEYGCNCTYRYGLSPVHIVSPDHSVKVHGDVLVVQLTPHDVVSVLQQIIKSNWSAFRL